MVGFLSPDAAHHSLDAADLQRAITAYRFWYPTVSAEGMVAGNRAAGLDPNKAVGIAATGPLQTGFTLNSDTPYGSAILDLTAGPIVIEIPAGPFIGLVNDHHQRWITDMGIPGPDAGQGGSYVIVPPDHDDAVPTGHHVGHAQTFTVFAAFRSMPADGDLDGALTALRRIKIHPLGSDAAFEHVDFSTVETDFSCLAVEDNIGYWRTLHEVLDAEPMADEFRPMYGLLAALGIGKGQPFAPDERMTRILEQAARTARDQMLASAFASRRSDRIAWPDRRWEWVGLVADNADFEIPAGMDLEARDRWFIQAIVTSPAMFRRQVGGGSLYWLGACDAAGDYLDGSRRYTVEVPTPVPAQLFWSVTVYDAQTRSQVRAEQGKAALRSLFELRDVSATGGSVTLHFGPERPDGDAADLWLQTVPDRDWFAYFRIYGPQQPAFDGSWRLGDFVAA